MKTRPQSDGSPSDPLDGSDLLDWALLRGAAGFLLYRAPRRHKLLFFFCFLSVVTVAVAALQVLPERFAVQTTVLAQSNPLTTGAARDADRLRAAREIVTRRDNLASLLTETGFVDRHMATRSTAGSVREWIYKVMGRELTREERVEALLDAVETRFYVLSKDEGTITIGFEWSNPELAFDVVKEALQRFLDARRLVEVSSFDETIAILEGHAAEAQREITQLSKRLTEKEDELRKTRPARRPRRLRPGLDTEMAKLDALLEAKKRAYQAMEEYRERRTTELRAELSQQETVYAPAHPILATTRRNLDALAQPSPDVETLRGEISDLEREIRMRGGRPGDSVRMVDDDLSVARLQLEDEDPRLEQERYELRLAFRNYSNLLADIAAARVAQDAARAGFKYRYSVVSPPQMPRGPIWPKKFKITVAAVVGGLLLGLFASAAADLRTGVVLEPWQVGWQVGLPVLSDLRRRPARE